MKGYRWATRVALAGLGVLALWAVFVAVVRVLDVPVGGIQPEAFALTAMMTAPMTLGAVLLMTLGTAGLEGPGAPPQVGGRLIPRGALQFRGSVSTRPVEFFHYRSWQQRHRQDPRRPRSRPGCVSERTVRGIHHGRRAGPRVD